MAIRKKLLIGDKVEKVIKAIVPPRFVPRNCKCTDRQDWLNGETREEALKRLEDKARAEKYGL